MASPEQGDVASQQNGDGKDDGVYFDSEDTEEFEAVYSRHARKTIFLGHRRWLRRQHRWKAA